MVPQAKRPELPEAPAGAQGCCSWRHRQQGPPSKHTRRTSRAASAPLTSHQSPSPKESRRPWRSITVRGCWTTLFPGGIAQSWRGDLCITAGPWLASPIRRSPRAQLVPAGADPLVHKVYVARGNVDDMTRCTACPLLRGHSGRFVGCLLGEQWLSYQTAVMCRGLLVRSA